MDIAAFWEVRRVAWYKCTDVSTGLSDMSQLCMALQPTIVFTLASYSHAMTGVVHTEHTLYH